jgi:8-oxo-dGTP diphosphatase
VGIGSLIIREGKILIGKRLDAHGAGTYMIPGGHLEFGESFEECAMREATEECGLKGFEVKGLVSIGNNLGYGKHYVGLGILLESKSGEPYDAEPGKSGDWKWYDPKDIPENMFPESLKVIKNYLAGKIYTDKD